MDQAVGTDGNILDCKELKMDEVNLYLLKIQNVIRFKSCNSTSV